MTTPGAVRLIACVIVQAGMAVGCNHDSRRSPSSVSRSVTTDIAVADAAELTSLPIHLDHALGADLRLAGLQITAQPDRQSWIVTVYSTVPGAKHPRPHLWVHAYPQGSATYFNVDPVNTVPPTNVGQVITDAFVLTRAGAFNLYMGVTGTDGSLGPAVGLGWIGVGDPDTPEYHVAYRFLQEADDTRAAAMLEQTQHAYPNARLP